MAMTKELKTSPLLDLDAARVMLGGISRRSVERLIARRRLRVVRPGGLRRVFVRVTDVQRLIR